MKRTIQLTFGLCLLFMVSAVFAADWEVRAVSKQATNMPNTAGTSEEAGKFLHVTLDVAGSAPNWNKFKVVNEQGEEVATPAGYNPAQGLVVFEGDWSNMIGRYLENGDVRVPLFQKEAPVDAAPEAVVVQETPAPQPVAVDRPVQPVVVDRPVVDRPVTVIDRDPVVVHEGVDRRDVVHVYDNDRDRVVVHDDRDDVVVHHGDHDGVVVHDGDDVVVHHGGHGDVVHDGDVHHVYDGDDVHHVGDGAAYAGDGVGGGDGGAGGAGVAEVTPWDIDPLGRTLGMSGTVAMGDTAGVGGFGAGYGAGYGAGIGTGSGPGSGPGDGSGTGSGMGDGSGDDGDCEDGDCGTDGNGEGPGPGEAEGPEELDPAETNPDAPPAPGNGPGAGGNNMSNFVNLAPQYRQRVRNLAPKMKLPEVPVFYGPDVLVYNPQIPYWNPQLPYYNPSMGYGGGGGGGYGSGSGGGSYPPPNLSGVNFAPTEMPPGMVLYISTGDENSSGKVYQVDEQGRVLGVVNLPHTATGIALHRDHGLVCVCPREGGKVYRINDGGIVEPVMEKDAKMIHPVDVAVGPDSDSMVVADNIADTLSLSNVQGKALDTYKKFEGLEHLDHKNMSVAVGRDRAILFGTDGDKGIYRFTGNAALASSTPVLPEAGGVAADPSSDRWAATQGSNRVVVMEGENEVANYELPAGKFFYNDGLVSFAPPAGIAETTGGSGVVVAMRDSDNAESAPYLMEFKTDSDGKVDQRLLFDWKHERMVDFVVGPRMLWEQNHRDTYKGMY